jgi:hypothetical protein
MTPHPTASIPTPDAEGFFAATNEFAAGLGWQLRSFTRDSELVALVALDWDPSFEEIIWAYDTERAFARCLLVCRAAVPTEREIAIIELCARINDGLYSGCAEYSFGERTLCFRDTIQLGSADMRGMVRAVSERVIGLGSRYAPVIQATLDGLAPAEAIRYEREPRTAGTDR